MHEISDFKCRYIAKEQIWQEAENFRAKFWSENILPVDIEAIVEKRLKLNIEPEHNLLSELDIDAYLRVDLTGIIVDYNCYMNEPKNGSSSWDFSVTPRKAGDLSVA